MLIRLHENHKNGLAGSLHRQLAAAKPRILGKLSPFSLKCGPFDFRRIARVVVRAAGSGRTAAVETPI
jgi:hypothetical protein